MNKILLIGTGYMAKEYLKVLQFMNLDFNVLGNSQKSCDTFFMETNVEAKSGSIENIDNIKEFDFAINAASSDQLYKINIFLIANEIKNILCEKPGANNIDELENLNLISLKRKLNFFIAYNRRFYSSVNKLMELVDIDGGVQSFCFDFTEWESTVLEVIKDRNILKNWFVVNSLHVVDLAFFIGGTPIEINSNIMGESSWHKPMVFCGSGITNKDALFSYNANWNSAGRWGIEINTKDNKYILRPLEGLKYISKGTTEENDISLNDKMDIEFKPGLYEQVNSFINNQNDHRLISLNDHTCNFKSNYLKILNG
tara:strand:- start:420 stop:1358 length:939 start_codon:yes stop_codon:yes gene_type:complete